MNSVYKRHFSLTVGIIMIAFIVLGICFMGLSLNYMVREKKAVLGDDASYVSNMLSVALEGGGELDPSQLKSTLHFVTDVSNADVIICKPNGQIIFDHDGDPFGEDTHQSEDSILEQLMTLAGIDTESTGDQSAEKNADKENAFISSHVLDEIDRTGRYEAMDSLGLYGKEHFAVGTPILVEDRAVGYVLVTASSENLTNLWRTFFTLYLWVALLVLVFAVISSFWATRRQAKPLREMTDVVRRFGMGEYDLRAQENCRDESIRDLARAFNTMADAISTAEQQRQEFVANISHELKTPMTTIQGFADGILDGTIPPEKQPEVLRTISDETRRLSRLVRRMLDTSRLAVQGQTVLCQTQFDIVETYARVLISLERKINSKRLEVDAQFPDTPTKVWGDPDAITQVCYNLLDNAIKFASPATTIGLGINVKGNKAHIWVRNVGETIPKEELALIFDRFHKSDRSRSLDKEGVGLGLYIVKTILNNHKESIHVTSENGVTEFVFTLTMAE